MCGGDEEARNVIVVTDFGTFWVLITKEWLATDVALSRVVILLLLRPRESLHWNVVLQLLNALPLPVDDLS